MLQRKVSNICKTCFFINVLNLIQLQALFMKISYSPLEPNELHPRRSQGTATPFCLILGCSGLTHLLLKQLELSTVWGIIVGTPHLLHAGRDRAWLARLPRNLSCTQSCSSAICPVSLCSTSYSDLKQLLRGPGPTIKVCMRLPTW